jgi:hypothetical protein
MEKDYTGPEKILDSPLVIPIGPNPLSPVWQARFPKDLPIHV